LSCGNVSAAADWEIEVKQMVSNGNVYQELVSAIFVFTIGGTAGRQSVDVIFKLFSRMMVEAEGSARVVRNYVLPVSDTVRALKEWGDVVRKRLVTNARLSEVDRCSRDSNGEKVHLSN
jgi:hypothetical protein